VASVAAMCCGRRSDESDVAMRSRIRQFIRIMVDRDARLCFIDAADRDSVWAVSESALAAARAGATPGSPLLTAATADLFVAASARRMVKEMRRADTTGQAMQRHLAASPFLQAMLREAPQTLPFAVRVEMLGGFVRGDRQRNAVDKVKFGLKVRRTHCLQDGFEQLQQLAPSDVSLLRARFHVKFIDQHGGVEPGIDAGGVFKEFIELLLKQAFDPTVGLFRWTEDSRFLHPSAQAVNILGAAEAANSFRFLGRIVGKAIYEGVLVNLPFAPFFLNNVLGRGNGLDDLRQLDATQFSSLQRLKDMDDVSLAEVYFAVEDDCLGVLQTTDLIPGGNDIQVTNDNVVRYLHVAAHHRLVGSTKTVTDMFVQGMYDIVDRNWLRMFSAPELQQLISGGDHALDIAELTTNTKFLAGYDATSRPVLLLWEVVREMTVEDQGRFMQFCTGSSRPPVLGFGAMTPPFSVSRNDGGDAGVGGVKHYFVDIDRLPTASTCFNLLKLPPYKNKGNLRDKLLQAIRSGAGFDLS
jgi:hypothetical protein